MRCLPGLFVAALLLGCPQDGAQPAAAGGGDELLLVEAELASRLRTGQIPGDAFCEAEVPYFALRGRHVEMRCGQQAELDAVVEEVEVQGARQLKTQGGRTLRIEKIGRERYRIRGSLCDRTPTVYIAFPDARSYRQTWLKGARCPTEAMKLAE